MENTIHARLKQQSQGTKMKLKTTLLLAAFSPWLNFADITFEVSCTQLAEKPIETFPAAELMMHQTDRQCEAFGVEAKELIPTPINPFIYSAQRAFNDHRPLVLSPDIFWLTICQGLSTHINEAPEAFREKLVKHLGRELISIRRDGFVKGSAENDWAGTFPEYLKEMSKFANDDLIATINSKFSTTSAVEQAVFQVTVMDTFKRYFIYECSSFCGIPSITLQGTEADWAMLIEKTKKLRQYDLDWWVDELLPILEKVHETAKGKVDKDFWQSFYKFEDESGGPYVTGWILKLFPYLESAEEKFRNPFMPIPLTPEAVAKFKLKDKAELEAQGKLFMKALAKRGLVLGVTTDQFPSGLVHVPFNWLYFGTHFKMEFVAGFLGVSQADNLALTAEIGWAVADMGQVELDLPEGLMKYLCKNETGRIIGFNPNRELVKTIENLDFIKDCYGLESLNLPGYLFKTSDLKVLKSLDQLRAINLQGCQANHELLQALTPHKYLQTLILADNKIDDQMIASLKQFPYLRTLDISGCKISSQTLANIVQIKSLDEVICIDAKLSKEAIDALTPAAHITLITQKPDDEFGYYNDSEVQMERPEVPNHKYTSLDEYGLNLRSHYYSEDGISGGMYGKWKSAPATDVPETNWDEAGLDDSDDNDPWSDDSDDPFAD